MTMPTMTMPTMTMTAATAAALAGGGDFAAAASDLLGELGYRSERILPGQSGGRRRPGPAVPGS